MSTFDREYLATFKKTVAMHETFLTRLANHNVFREEHNFKVFLEYDQDVSDQDVVCTRIFALQFYYKHGVTEMKFKRTTSQKAKLFCHG